MTRYFSKIIAWGCLAILFLTPLAAIFYLAELRAFAALAKQNLNLPIQWQSVTDMQWYGLWIVTVIYLAIAWGGLYFLRRAFLRFAQGQLFSLVNSRDLRLFSVFLFAHALAKPVHFAIASMLLSWNHPAGQKMLSISIGSDEVKIIALAMIVWVISDLLVKAATLENENKQFI